MNNLNKIVNRNQRILLAIAFMLSAELFPKSIVAQDRSIVLKEFIFDTASFMQCHASTIAETADGLIVAWFGGTREGNKDVEIWASKMNNGRWSVPESVANGIKSGRKRYPCWNPVLYTASDRSLILFYKVGPSPDSWWGEWQRSTDFGNTWEEPKVLPKNIIGPVKNKPVLIPSGELICGSSTENKGWRIHFESTADWGNSWNRTGSVNSGKDIQVIQPAILTHSAGRLQAICRSREGYLMMTWSEDGGHNWSAVSQTHLPNPNSGIDAVTLSNGLHIIVYNHSSMLGTEWGGPRTPLNVAVSQDGLNWSAVAVLENENGEFSYPAIIQTSDGLVHVTYTWNRIKIRHLILDPSEFKPEPIINGIWPD